MREALVALREADEEGKDAVGIHSTVGQNQKTKPRLIETDLPPAEPQKRHHDAAEESSPFEQQARLLIEPAMHVVQVRLVQIVQLVDRFWCLPMDDLLAPRQFLARKQDPDPREVDLRLRTAQEIESATKCAEGGDGCRERDEAPCSPSIQRA